jgi:hypothetical protein
MALLPGSIFVERSFIPDPAMVSLVVTSLWLLVVYLKNGRLPFLILAILFGTWGCLTKIPGLIAGLPAIYAVAVLLRRTGRLTIRQLVLMVGAGTLVLLPVGAYYLWARYLALHYPPHHFAGSGNWVWDEGLRSWLDQGYFLSKLSWNFRHWIWTEPAIILAGLGLVLPLVRGPFSGGRQPAWAAFSLPWLFHVWMLAGVIYYLIGARELVINAWNFHLLNPAAAVLVAYALLYLANLVGRVAFPIRAGPAAIVNTVVILVGLAGILLAGQRQLKYMYQPHWDSAVNYRMGLALGAVSAPGDLVITIPGGTIEPVAIYYSGRRGWSFPPLWPGVTWAGGEPPEDGESIALFEELRRQGADWIAIAAGRKGSLWQNNPKFMKHLAQTSQLVKYHPEWVIYRIVPAR